ncbi:MAG: DUF1559 domain-containing protein [Armatimonadota bacterium]|nr:DUF1559 domain-containing protein [Armatimonadota bacterium]
MSRRRAGFTLIELLVVVAIIAILAAILFPIFAAAKEAGKKASCLANLKQIGNALAMYRDEYDGHNPGIWANWGQSGSWDDKASFWWVMLSYIKSRMGKDARNIVKCPSASWLKQDWTIGSTNRERKGFAYQINETGWTDGRMPRQLRDANCLVNSLMDASIKRPGYLIHIGDSMGWPGFGIAYQSGANVDNESAPKDGSGPVGWTSIFPQPNDPVPMNGDKVGAYGGTTCKIYGIRVSHQGGANVLIYDGHVKNVKFTTGRYWGNYF